MSRGGQSRRGQVTPPHRKDPPARDPQTRWRRCCRRPGPLGLRRGVLRPSLHLRSWSCRRRMGDPGVQRLHSGHPRTAQPTPPGLGDGRWPSGCPGLPLPAATATGRCSDAPNRPHPAAATRHHSHSRRCAADRHRGTGRAGGCCDSAHRRAGCPQDPCWLGGHPRPPRGQHRCCWKSHRHSAPQQRSALQRVIASPPRPARPTPPGLCHSAGRLATNPGAPWPVQTAHPHREPLQ
mmetsp:Transcript_19398/g.43013  ORF Transcript_19398/g.43013 Transcript_19398/m.43013 type:complete len:236 (+) Transcript_19398:269-976(+)